MTRLFATLLAFLAAAGWCDTELTVMTYNIRVGVGPGRAISPELVGENLDRIAEVIRASGADVVLLQEVDQGVVRSGGIDETRHLSDALRMNVCFAPALEFGGGHYGIALLTTWEIVESGAVPLFRPDYSESHPEYPEHFSEQRVALIARLASGERTITAIDTHLGLTADQRDRQLAEIAELVQPHLLAGPVIVGGDLNCEPASPELAHLSALRPVAEASEGLLTFPADDPVRAIDHVYVSPGVRVISSEVLVTDLSDHRPLVTRIALPD